MVKTDRTKTFDKVKSLNFISFLFSKEDDDDNDNEKWYKSFL